MTAKCPFHIDLINPDNYKDAIPNHRLQELRADAPISWHEDGESGVGFWVITKYEDLEFVSKNPQIFSSAERSALFREMDDETVVMQRMMMLNMDPPDHLKYRRIVNKAFMPKVIDSRLPLLEQLAKDVVDQVAQKGECEFVTEVAADLPLITICELMGVREDARKMIFDNTNTMVFADDPDMSTSEEDGQAAAAEIYAYGMQLVAEHRENPTDTLTGMLIDGKVDGESLTEDEFCSFFLLLLVAGNETTRTVTVNGMRLLMEHPDQLQKLVEDPSKIPNAVEEMLRHQPAVIQFRRTAMQDIEMRGQQIKKGDKIIMFYPSANRDEDVFEDGDEFDITRANAEDHRSFGIGEHFCLGTHLARLELNLIF